MWESSSGEASIYRSIQFSLAIDRIIALRKFGYEPAKMTVQEIYKASKLAVDSLRQMTIMDAARVKQVSTKNSLISD